MAFEAQVSFVEIRMAHIRDMDRTYERVLEQALNKCARTYYGTSGRNISTLGINAFSPDPITRYIGNARHGRVLKTKPQDMAGKWEYELDAAGCVLRAQWHSVAPAGVAENILVSSVVHGEHTYLQYWKAQGHERRQDHSIVYSYDEQGKIVACLKLSWVRKFDVLHAELDEFCWDGDRLLWVENFNFCPSWMVVMSNAQRRVTLLGEKYEYTYRRFCVRADQ